MPHHHIDGTTPQHLERNAVRGRPEEFRRYLWMCVGRERHLESSSPVGCPAGFAELSDDPDLPCMQPQFCWECYLKQICRRQSHKRRQRSKGSDRDGLCVARARAELKFERIYNSAGFFDTGAGRETVNTDYWRNTYSSRVVPYTGSAYLLAMLQMNNGVLVPFNPSGNEIQNNDGAARHLVKNGDNTWTLTTPDNDVEQYDTTGKLTSITTRSGFVTTLIYDGSARLQTIADSYGRSITLAYDASGRIATMTDPSSRVYTYAYDGLGRMITVDLSGFHGPHLPLREQRAHVRDDGHHRRAGRADLDVRLRLDGPRQISRSIPALTTSGRSRSAMAPTSATVGHRRLRNVPYVSVHQGERCTQEDQRYRLVYRHPNVVQLRRERQRADHPGPRWESHELHLRPH